MNPYISAARSLFSSKPNYLIQYVTARCPARCKMCFYWEEIQSAKKNTELTLEEFELISGNLGDLQQVTLTGGEPFVRADLPEIARIFDKNNKVNFISIPTSSLLVDRTRESVRQILETTENCHLVVCLSLDALGGDHDEIRGVPGCFDKVRENYRNMVELKENVKNFHIKINMTISAFNHDKIEETAEFARHEMPLAAFNFNFVRGNSMEAESKDIGLEEYRRAVRIAREKHNHTLSDFALSRVIKGLGATTSEIIEERLETDRRTLPCTAGRKMLVISETGVVRPCEILGEEFGNLRDYDYDFAKLLKLPDAQTVCAHIKDKKCCCTFENAILNSSVSHPQVWPKLIKNIVRAHA